jgi:hypothetical protein
MIQRIGTSSAYDQLNNWCNRGLYSFSAVRIWDILLHIVVTMIQLDSAVYMVANFILMCWHLILPSHLSEVRDALHSIL